MREVKLRAFRVGHCRHPEAMTIRGGSLKPIVYPALATLLMHPDEGPILFDTGYDPAFLAATEPFPERFYRWLTPPTLPVESELIGQLAKAGIAARDVRHVVLSHFHADHMAGVHHFPHATIHCARAGHEAACRGGRVAALRRGVLRALIPPDFVKRARYFEDGPRVALPGDLAPFDVGIDLLGDGSLLAVELPGHCPGHWGLLVGDADRGPHFLVADAAWSSDAIRRNVPPPVITRALLGDARAGGETLARLHALHRRNHAIALTPCHCAERVAELTRSR
jgi:glyoxylase-like metal-dependent hydrolase (beta-lactamase superfamily II)